MMHDLARYHRQMLLAGFGEEGQHALARSHALIVGCGALGTVIADALARAGVGTLSIIDRDIVELTNLQRQVLFTERDVEVSVPKAIAAQAAIGRINSQVTVNAHVEDFNHTNAERLSAGADIILDGLDNFQTRYLLNDLSVKLGVPYVYGGAVGTTGMACAFIREDARPHEVANDRRAGGRADGPASVPDPPCLRCIFPEAPPPGSTPTCDTAGVLGSVAAIISQYQVTQTIKILTGNLDAVDRWLLSIDIWRNEWRRLDITRAAAAECPCCVHRRFEYLDGVAGNAATSLCGRGAVQINPRLLERARSGDGTDSGRIDLSRLAERLASHGEFRASEHLLRGRFRSERGDDGSAVGLTVFADGRVIVAGTARPEFARSIYDKYVGG